MSEMSLFSSVARIPIYDNDELSISFNTDGVNKETIFSEKLGIKLTF